MVKIDIISGFLGAGKTTLIKKLLAEVLAGQQVVLIENEFGEIGVDGAFLKESGIQIREMNSGCICCSLVGDFGESLREVIQTYHPDRILIEPSGVGKLSDVIKAVQGVQKDVEMELNSYTTVVDAKKAKVYMRNFGEFFVNQIQYAGTVILSRTDIIDEEKTEAALELVHSINPNAAVITTPIAELDGKKIFETMEHPASFEQELLDAEIEHHHHHHHDDEEHGHHHHHDDEEHEHHHHHDDEEHEHHHHHDDEEHEHHHHHGHEGHHHADEIFTSWGKETVRKYSREQIENILAALSDEAVYGAVLRAKGMLPSPDGSWIYFDMVPEEVELREGSPFLTGKICVIGSRLKEDKLAELFGC